MSNKPHKVPKRRFKRFLNAGDWEQRKFRKITFPSGVKNKENLPYESYSVTNENGFIPQNQQFENGGIMSTADKTMYYIVTPNSFAYNPARINVGSIGYYKGAENVIVSSLYEVFQTTEDIDDRFLWHWFKSKNFRRKIEQYQEGGVRLYFYYDKLCMCSLPAPSVYEQRKIGEYFDHLDNLITLHQRKLNKLKSLKSAYLSELFPKKGETNPSLRFSEFTDDWEQRKLVELCKSITYGLNVRAKIFDGKHKYLRITDIDDETRTFSTDNLTSPDCSLTKLTAYQLQEGDLVFSRTGASVGKTYVYQPSDGLVYHAGFLIRARILPDQNHHLIYQLTLTRNFRDYVLVTSQRLGQPGINAREYGAYQMVIPEVLEQNRLSNFLYSFDNLITLHQRK
jgi:type I restriction enzyme S subunit